MDKKKRGITAAELQAQLAADPVFQEQKRIREEGLRRKEELLDLAERPIIQDMHAEGFDVRSVWDFVNDKRPTPARAAEIMLKHLPGSFPDVIKEGIGRSLACTEPHDGWDILLHEYEREIDGSFGAQEKKFGIAMGLAAAADLANGDVIARLARNETHGSSRMPLLWYFERWPHPAGTEIMQELALDPELGKEARRILRKLSKGTTPRKGKSIQ